MRTNPGFWLLQLVTQLTFGLEAPFTRSVSVQRIPHKPLHFLTSPDRCLPHLTFRTTRYTRGYFYTACPPAPRRVRGLCRGYTATGFGTVLLQAALFISFPYRSKQDYLSWRVSGLSDRREEFFGNVGNRRFLLQTHGQAGTRSRNCAKARTRVAYWRRDTRDYDQSTVSEFTFRWNRLDCVRPLRFPSRLHPRQQLLHRRPLCPLNSFPRQRGLHRQPRIAQ